MAIEFVCPSCHGTLSVADDAVGRVVRCGSCLTTLRVPAPAADSRPASEAAPPPVKPSRAEPIEAPGSRGYHDEHGEPRPRRRGAAKKTAGRSPLFWLLVIVLVLGFLTCLSCGGLTLVLATPRWHTHESDDGGFKIDLPAPTNPDIAEQAKVNLKANEYVEGAMLIGRLELYWILYADIDRKGQRVDDEAILKAAIEHLKTDPPGTIVRETPKRVDGFPASEVVVTNQQGETHHCLIVVTKSRLYIAAAGGPFVNPEGNKRIRKFLDSFHIVKGGNPGRGNAAPKKGD